MEKLQILFLGLILLSCDSVNYPTLNVVEPVIIAQGNLYGNGVEGISKQNLIVDNKSTWNFILEQMNSVNNESDNFSETDIDFTSFQVIAIFDAIRSSGGYSLDINVRQDGQKRIVEVINIHPEGIAATVITQPYIIARIPSSDLPIEFQ